MAEAPGAGRGVVDVVIVTYNNVGTLGTALDSMRDADVVRSIVVVDNASSDGTLRVTDPAGVTVVEHEHNVGFAAGVNAGLAHCRSPYVLLLNPDAALTPEDLGRLVRILDADKGTVAAGPLLAGESGDVYLGGRRFSTPLNRLLALAPVTARWRYGRLGPEYPKGLIEAGDLVPVDYLWGAAALVRREFLARIGGLDEQFFLYSEDEDLGRVARAMGLRMVVTPTVRAAHVGGASSAGDDGLALARLGHALRLGLAKWTTTRQARLFSAGFRSVLVLRILRDALRADGAAVVCDFRALSVYARLRHGSDPAGTFRA